jgi:hypothetical protein
LLRRHVEKLDKPLHLEQVAAPILLGPIGPHFLQVLSAIRPVGGLRKSPLHPPLHGVERDALFEMPIDRGYGTA